MAQIYFYDIQKVLLLLLFMGCRTLPFFSVSFTLLFQIELITGRFRTTIKSCFRIKKTIPDSMMLNYGTGYHKSKNMGYDGSKMEVTI